jgi:hypothetical protein
MVLGNFTRMVERRRVWVRENINSVKVVCCGEIRYNKNAAEVKISGGLVCWACGVALVGVTASPYLSLNGK